MNKRQQKKVDKQLTMAIIALNNDVARSEGFPPISEQEAQKTLLKVKTSKAAINRTLRDYKRFIVQK